jgi:predicted alpha/beta-fold hydrolase
LQTLYAVLRPLPRVRLQRERWDTPDGDFIDVDFAGDAASTRRLALFHGLEGSAESHYARAIAGYAAGRGWRIALPHFRGCSGEPNRKPRAYHSGDTEELDWILKRLGPGMCAVGISLGGNALLKWLGERGAQAPLRRAVAVSAPIDLAAAGEALDGGLNRVLYTRHFLRSLKPKSLAKLAAFPGLYDAAVVRAARTFRVFDNAVTAPLHGFRDVDHYWSAASSGPWLEHIRVPTLLLNARNDPFLPEHALLAAARKAAPCVVLEFPHQGGHVGFRHPWLAQRILRFLDP